MRFKTSQLSKRKLTLYRFEFPESILVWKSSLDNGKLEQPSQKSDILVLSLEAIAGIPFGVEYNSQSNLCKSLNAHDFHSLLIHIDYKAIESSLYYYFFPESTNMTNCKFRNLYQPTESINIYKKDLFRVSRVLTPKINYPNCIFGGEEGGGCFIIEEGAFKDYYFRVKRQGHSEYEIMFHPK